MKGTHPHKPPDLWFCDIMINEELHMTTFTKAFRYQIWNEKKNIVKCFYSLNLKIIWLILYPEIN